MAKFEENRTYLNQIIDAMSKAITEQEARLAELKDQRKMLEEAIEALNVYEHIKSEKE